MKLVLISIHYNFKTLVGFSFFNIRDKKLIYVDKIGAKQIINSQNTVYGLGVNSSGELYGTNGNLDRYTKIVNNNIQGKASIVVVSKYKDKFLVYTGRSVLTYLNFRGILDILKQNNVNNHISNAKINKNGFISPIRGGFHIENNKLNGGNRDEFKAKRNDRERSRDLGKDSLKESREQRTVNSGRKNSISSANVREDSKCKRDSRVYIYDGLGENIKLSKQVHTYLTQNKFNPQTDSEKFTDFISEAKKNNRHGACVDLHSGDEYKEMRCLSFDDGKAGVAVHSGNITSVFKNDDSNIKGFIKLAMLSAILTGGEKLDCYSIDSMLPSMYAECGMIPVCRVAFNREFAPSDWDFDAYGEPYIVFMVYCGEDIDNLYENYGKYKPFSSYTDEEIPVVDDLDWMCAYDVATAIRDYRLAQIKCRKLGEIHERKNNITHTA